MPEPESVSSQRRRIRPSTEAVPTTWTRFPIRPETVASSTTRSPGRAVPEILAPRIPASLSPGNGVIAGSDSLQALSPTTCRPFDARRDGLALGEGAAVLALESFEHAKARGATILAEVAGYGAATDRHHLTQPHPAGDAALTTMSEACLQAGIGPSEVGYLNAHGTGTPLNDSAEAAAIHRWAGESVGQLRVSSTKGCVGHLLGAAGAVEAAVCVLALREQWLPPGVGVATPDPACHFPLLSGPASAEFEHVLSNSFGFGGANASLVLRRVR